MFKRSLDIPTLHVKYCVYLLSTLLSFFYCNSAKSQWKVSHSEPQKTNIVSLIPSKSKQKPGYLFFGLSQSLKEDVIRTGYEPFQNDSLWKLSINKRLSSFLRHFYFNIYSKNVSALNIHICDTGGTCYEKKISFSKDGYQSPFEWVMMDDSKLDKIILTHQQNALPTFTAKIELKNVHQDYQFTVGEAKTYEQSYVKRTSKGMFFYELTRKRENRLKTTSIRDFGDSYPLLSSANFNTYTGSAFNFEPENADTLSIHHNTLSLIRFFFQKYPFYKEHDIDSAKNLSKVDHIISDSSSFSIKVEQLKLLANRLYDGHFYFKDANKSRIGTSSPLIVKRIKDKLQVVAVRDNRLVDEVKLGDQILDIDDQSPTKLIDSLSINYFGDLNQRQELAISHLLDNIADFSIKNLLLKHNDGSEYKLRLKYDKIFPIPKQFVPEHFGFRKFSNSWSYLKINKWDKGDWIKFYNLKDSIKEANGIILDLRGNPGGFEIEAIKIASCFIKKPFEYCTQTYSTINKRYVGKTTIKPNDFLNLADMHVIILVDNKTACASESFTMMLKKTNAARVIGSAKTSGSFSTVYSFQLPENINLSANVFSKTYISNEHNVLENKGISPDVLVNIDAYSDLYGYKDKVLETALDFTK